MRRESQRALRSRANQMAQILSQTYPDAHCELNFDSPFQLLVATVLSAQSTDKRVNQVTPELFGRWPDAQKLAVAELTQLEDVIRPVGFFRSKAMHLVGLSQKIIDDFDGVVPNNLEALITLPGVGRKTANVVLGNAFGIPGITPDTHFMRLSRRFGWTKATTPDAIEKSVGLLFDPPEWVDLCHRIIWHGRRICKARKPQCAECVLAHLCPSAETP